MSTRRDLPDELVEKLILTDGKIENSEDRKSEKRWTRRFIVWDGEGAHSTRHTKRPQDYVLLGYYDGTEHDFISDKRLNTFDCLRFIVDTGAKHPGAIHVSFAFGYDVEEILRNLTPRQFTFLRDRGYVRLIPDWRIEHVPGKWLAVTKYLEKKRVRGQTKRITVKIFDVWGFFQSSLVAALDSYIPDHPLWVEHGDEIKRGKKRRAEFTYKDIDYITEYWRVENEVFYALVEKLRELLYSVDLKISSWHGPGALANHAYRTNGVAVHKSDCGPEIYDAARFAYAGGRIERFKVGRFVDAYGYDINSAYPNAISRLPSLSEGEWRHVNGPIHEPSEFGVYRVTMRGPAIKRDAAPLFHRDSAGNISFPWRTSGWYWTPEVRTLANLSGKVPFEISEGWEYVGWHTRPFEFVAEMYRQRREMKRAGIGSEKALKLCLNSLYGKMAQRAGWQRAGGAPRWHQLEWAGWVTSYTRAMLYSAISSMSWDKVIAVETDGLYCTASPQELGISDSKELGGWEVVHYDELIYLQSGLYAKRIGSDWSIKFRGLDRSTVESLDADEQETGRTFIEHCKRLLPNVVDWPKLEGKTTRFIGYRNALWREEQNRGGMKTHHCVWETEPREIDCGSVGKRVHSPKICKACAAGATAYEMGHETIIKSRAMLKTDTADLMSHRHDIPWLDHEGSRFAWRDKQDEEAGLLT